MKSLYALSTLLAAAASAEYVSQSDLQIREFEAFEEPEVVDEVDRSRWLGKGEKGGGWGGGGWSSSSKSSKGSWSPGDDSWSSSSKSSKGSWSSGDDWSPSSGGTPPPELPVWGGWEGGWGSGKSGKGSSGWGSSGKSGKGSSGWGSSGKSGKGSSGWGSSGKSGKGSSGWGSSGKSGKGSSGWGSSGKSGKGSSGKSGKTTYYEADFGEYGSFKMSVDSNGEASYYVNLRNLDWITVSELSWHLHSGKVGPGARDASAGSAVACGADYTAGHYDPMLRCGSASTAKACSEAGAGEPCCEEKPAADYCVNANIDMCEVGDLSGLYGKILVNDNMGQKTADGPCPDCAAQYDPTASATDGSAAFNTWNSIVFHGSAEDSSARVLCADITRI